MGWQHQRESRHQRGLGKDWDRLRKQVMRRDLFLCQPCKRAGRLTPATECDHIVPRSKGGTNIASNAEAICGPCHRAKTDAEMGHKRKREVGFDGYGRVMWDDDQGAGGSTISGLSPAGPAPRSLQQNRDNSLLAEDMKKPAG